MRRALRCAPVLLLVLFLLSIPVSSIFATSLEISVGDASISEANSGITNLMLPVSFNMPLPSNTGFTVRFTRGSVDEFDGDPLDEIQQFQVMAGANSTYLTYTVYGDTDIEPDEFVAGQILRVDQPAVLLDDSGIGWILNDDGIPVGPRVHTDSTCTSAAVDNQIALGEYQMVQLGTNSGFGNVIGKNALLHWNSDSAGGLQFALTKGPGDLNDAVVIYIDSVPGGQISTEFLTDEGDELRAAISGQATSNGDSARLDFSVGFAADYAIAFDSSYAGLWQLEPLGPHIFIKGLGLQPSTSTQVFYEFGAALAPFDALNLSDIGLTPGGSFNFIATYINPSDAFRSNEFIGAAESTADSGNIGATPFALAEGDFSTVHSLPRPVAEFTFNSPFYYEGETAFGTLDHHHPDGYLWATDCTATYAYDFTGTATELVDYIVDPAIPYPLVVAPGQAVAPFIFSVVDDTDIEGDEVVNGLFNSTDGGDDSASFSLPLLDNEIIVSLAYGQTGPDVNEGADFSFIVQLNQAAPYDVEVSVVPTPSGTAEPDEDYPSANIIAKIFAGDTFVEKTISLPDDLIYEGTETFSLRLQGNAPGDPPGVILDPPDLPVNILDDESVSQISIDDVQLEEMSEGDNVPGVLNISVTPKSESPLIIAYTTQDDQATAADSDFEADSGTVTIPALVGSGQVPFTIIGDDKFEADEIFLIVLSNPADPFSGLYTVGDDTGQVEILNDDALPSVSITDNSVTEGTTDPVTNGTITISVMLSNPSSLPITVTINTADGTATLSDLDYSGLSDYTVTFDPGETLVELASSVQQDAKHEADETFTATLSDPTNAMLGIANATYTILNDDAAPTLSIDSTDVVEGDTGLSDPEHAVMQFQFVLSAESGLPVTFNWAAVEGTSTGDFDFLQTGSSGSVTIAAGDLSASAFVDILGETMFEDDETVGVELSSISGATLDSPNPTYGTIMNDDPVPTLSIVPDPASAEPVEVTELDGSNNVTVTFNAVLSNPTEETVSFSIQTNDGTAVRPDDYNTFFEATDSITPGNELRTFSFLVRGDNIYETDEEFSIELISVTNATPGDVLIAYRILDNETMPTVTIMPAADEPEGNSGATNFEWEIVLSHPSAFLTQVNITTIDGTATLANNDYMTNSGVVEFPAGEVVQPFNIVVNGDTAFEPDETVGAELSHAVPPSPVIIGTPNPAFGTIINDDAAPNALDNGGFEGGDLRDNLTPWVLAKAVGDKVRCTPQHSDAKPNTGTCSFRFKGSATEATTIKQTLQTQVRGFADLMPGMNYHLTLFYQGGTSAVLKSTVKITYQSDVAGLITDKVAKTFRGPTSSAFVQGMLDIGVLPAGVTKVQVILLNKSESGKLYVDDVALFPVFIADERSAPLPLPAAPSGWNSGAGR